MRQPPRRQDLPGHSFFLPCFTLCVALFIAGLPTVVRAQTASIPIDTLPAAPTSGTLSNGVNFSVNRGSAHFNQGYVILPSQSPQIWTFDQPVSLRFGLRGLNMNGECFRVPVGTVAQFIHPSHNWNAASRTVCETVNTPPAAQSNFTLAGPVTELRLEAINQGAGGRGPAMIEVTVNIGIDLDKTAIAPDPLLAGSTVDYTFVVTNTGDVTLSDVAVTDPMPGISPVSCPSTTLIAGADMTCSATYEVTPADVAAGAITNTATATGTPATGTAAVTATDSTTVSPTAMPAINLEKNGDGPDPLVAGATVDYSFLVTNTGNVPLSGIGVTDPLAGLSAISCPGTNLGPDASMTCTATYEVTNADVLAGTIENTATVEGMPPSGPDVSAQDSASVPPAQLPAIAIEKTGSGPDPLVAGTNVNYEFLILNTGNMPLTDVTVTDPLPGLPPVACPATALFAGESMTCTASYVITPADVAAGTINNTATVTGTPPSGPQVTAQDSVSVPPLQIPGIAIDKTATGPDPLLEGATVSYMFVVTNTGNVPLTNVAVTDPLPGLSPVACPDTTLDAGTGMTCTASYTVTAADVTAGFIDNTATAAGTPPSGPDVTAQDSASIPPAQLPSIAIDKTGSGPDPLLAGGTVNYTLLVTNTGNVPLTNVTVTDPLPGLSPLACPATTLLANGSMTCTASYVITPADVAAGTINNTATVTGTPPSGPQVTAQDSASMPPAQLPAIAIEKNASGPDPLTAGATVNYEFVVSNSGNVPLTDVSVVDPMPGLSAVDCPASSLLPGVSMTCAATYQVTPDDVAAAVIDNTATASGRPPSGDVVSAQDSVSLTPAQPTVQTAKTAMPGSDVEVEIGDTISYTLSVTVVDGPLIAPHTLTDTLGEGLVFAEVLTAGAYTTDLAAAPTLEFSLPAGTPSGTHAVSYSATVDPSVARAAEATVTNSVTASAGDCPRCVTHHAVLVAPEIQLAKAVAARDTRIGDLLRYTLSVTNVGNVDLVAGHIVDTPAAGFSFVAGSLEVDDEDDQVTVSGSHPLRFDGVDVPAGETATLAYLLRVGAGVRPGLHQNQAQVFASGSGLAISGQATASVELVGDPLLEESLIFGTVFHDRDGDGWQDSAALADINVSGGFAADAYVADSTTIIRAGVAEALPDNGAPLLHGLALGELRARTSLADPPPAVIIRQRLSRPAFTGDFLLSTAEGVSVRMGADGQTVIERQGDAARGLNAAAPRVERQVTPDDDGYLVEYVLHNDGIDERGIPGVRIASAEGLLIETDAFGRFHLAGIPGWTETRGRNFILKADPATLPVGATFTTGNPRVRRITAGVPVRFDWGVSMPVAALQRSDVLALESGEVFFAPYSAEVRPQYEPVIARIAASISEHGGGEIVIRAAAGVEDLALARTLAVREALLQRLDDATAGELDVRLRTASEDNALLVGFGGDGMQIGTVLFDTDSSAIRPVFEPLLERLAEALGRAGGGIVTIVGHADLRGADDYNVALGMRRATAVYEALAGRLQADARARLSVVSNADPAAPIEYGAPRPTESGH